MAQNAKINPPADESNLKSKSLNLKSFNICHVVLPCRQAGRCGQPVQALDKKRKM
jgi:hypothetical protein